MFEWEWRVFQHRSNQFYNLVDMIPVHLAVAVSSILFGIGLYINPSFAFGGRMLETYGVMVMYGYASAFVFCGAVGFFVKKPAPEVFLLIALPLTFHVLMVCVDLFVNFRWSVFSVLGVYPLLAYFIYKVFRRAGGGHVD